jgi:hypothetical protein
VVDVAENATCSQVGVTPLRDELVEHGADDDYAGFFLARCCGVPLSGFAKIPMGSSRISLSRC